MYRPANSDTATVRSKPISSRTSSPVVSARSACAVCQTIRRVYRRRSESVSYQYPPQVGRDTARRHDERTLAEVGPPNGAGRRTLSTTALTAGPWVGGGPEFVFEGVPLSTVATLVAFPLVRPLVFR